MHPRTTSLLASLLLVCAAGCTPGDPADEATTASALAGDDRAAARCFGALILGAWDGLPAASSQSIDVAAEMIASVDPSFTTIDPLNGAPFLRVPGVVSAVDGPRRRPEAVPNRPQVRLPAWNLHRHDPKTGYGEVLLAGVTEPSFSSGAANGKQAEALWAAMTRADQRTTTEADGTQHLTRTSPKGAVTCTKTVTSSWTTVDCRIAMVEELQPWSVCP